MAPVTIDDDDDDNQQCAFYQTTKERNAYDNDEVGSNFSQIKQEESSQDGYESDYGDSDCSVTSGVNRCLHDGPASYLDPQAVDFTILQADESATTTWTDEKHSSYLDSMEATFVQKMYDKEYCSLDVCGHSSHSSATLDPDCVESQPFCLNMRKPYEQRAAGLLTFRTLARPLPLLPSMWSSPWIQHFKSKKQNALSKIVSSRNVEFQDEGAPLEDIAKATSVTHSRSSWNEVSPPSSHDSAHRKRGMLISFPDCKYAPADSTITSFAGEYKKHKSQHSTLSQLDIIMEEQYNSEQHTNLGANIGIEDGKALNKLVASPCEHSETIEFLDNMVSGEMKAVEEKQDLIGISLQKLDQVVPLFQNKEGAGVCGKIISPDPGNDEEGVCCTHSTEPEDAITGSCSKTWTWGIDGPRYHLIGKNALPSSQV